MKGILYLLLLLLFPLFVFAQKLEIITKDYESSYQSSGHQWTLKVRTAAKGTKDPESDYIEYDSDMLIRYNVYRDGQEVHSKTYQGGSFYSCRPDWELSLEKVGQPGKEKGWLIGAMGTCGNTMSPHYELVVPSELYGDANYLYKRFVAKEAPHPVTQKQVTSIWYYQQNWGKGGTATSIFVPRKLDIFETEYGTSIQTGNILQGIDMLYKLSPEYSIKLAESFAGLFVAGIQDLNADLMEYAMQFYYSEEGTGFGLPVKKQELRQLIGKIRQMRATYQQVQDFVDWELFASHAIENPYWAEQQELEMNFKKWKAHQVSNYQFTLLNGCFCMPSSDFDPNAAITVKNNKIREIRSLEDNRTTLKASYYSTIPALFEKIQKAIKRQAAEIEVTYDKTLGYPLSIMIDSVKMIEDEEQRFTVKDFKRLD